MDRGTSVSPASGIFGLPFANKSYSGDFEGSTQRSGMGNIYIGTFSGFFMSEKSELPYQAAALIR